MLKLSINQITTRGLSLPDAVDAYARAGVDGISPWREHIEEHGTARAVRLFRESGLEVPSLCVCGLFTREPVSERRAILDDARRVIDMAHELGAPTVVTVAGGLLPESRQIGDARAYILECLEEIAAYAALADVKLGLEPLHPMNAAEFSLLSTLAQANGWSARLGPATGVIVDVYHTWWDPELAQGIEEAGRNGTLLGFHVSHWLVPTTDLMYDRGLPGDGVIDLCGIGEAMVRAGYDGWLEAELFSETLWSLDQVELASTVTDRLRWLQSQIQGRIGDAPLQ